MDNTCFFSCLRTLCDSGASVDLPNAKGETPLFTAVRRGDEAIVRQLLASGADPTKKTDKVCGSSINYLCFYSFHHNAFGTVIECCPRFLVT